MNRENHIPHPQPEEDRTSQEEALQDTPPQGEKEKPPYKPYSRKARLWAWVGIAFMVFLVLMYTYAFSSGIILKY